ncbi:MAG: hypothetical protein QHH43_03425 [Candidatus Saccharicenans sp.]|jgi:hypothetical protein|nr:hypothetical protein [Candidatus Saccharicenans sp.]MDH7574796.1 hypothetical protein [Candidatus Saccharicenans sp.]
MKKGKNYITFTLKLALLATMAVILAGTAPAAWYKFDRTAQPTFKEEIIISPGETQKNILAFGSRVVVEGKVEESVVVFGGEVTVSGEVGRSVVGFGSKVTIRSTAVIREDLVVLGGTMAKEPGCTIGQDTVFIPTGGKFASEIFRKGIFFQLGTIFLALKLISLFFGILLTIFVAGIFPRQVYFAAGKIRTDFWPTLGTGFLAMIIYAGLIMLSVLLLFVIIGIPILFMAILAGLVLKVFGGTAFSYFFGESFLRAVGVKRMPHVIWTAVIGLVIVTFLGLIPVLGFIFSLVVSLVGWGVAIRTRFGTMDNWLARNRS